MNQTPAAILVLAAAAMSFAAQTNSPTTSQMSVILTLCAIAVGVWGVISLIAACLREREMLIDSHARLDLIDRVMVREPLKALKEVARPLTREAREPRRGLEISAEVQARLNAAARVEGRDRSEILDEILRQHLPKYDQRAA